MASYTYTVLHGAKENCGDYFIRDAATRLLCDVVNVSADNLYFVDVVREELTDEQLEVIASTEICFLAGGPGYREDFFPETYPAMDTIMDVTDVVPMGPGWKGVNEDTYTFSRDSLEILRRIADQPAVPYLGARDLPTVRVLRNHGLPAELTGCPTWYYRGRPPSVEFDVPEEISTVVVSSPAKDSFQLFPQWVALLRMLSKKFPNAERICSFHRGENVTDSRLTLGVPWRRSMWEDNLGSILYKRLTNYAKKLGFELYDASRSAEYVNRYFDADLHVGYRVHAHIPFLIAGNPSFLIQVDGRGLGVSESLRTHGDVWVQGGRLKPVSTVADNIDRALASDCSDFKAVERALQDGYDNMEGLLKEATSTAES